MPAFAPLLHNWIVPLKFLALVGHLIATLLVEETLHSNILAGVSSDYSDKDYDFAKHSVQAWIRLSIVCFVLNFATLFIGHSVFFSKTINLVQLLLHALGGIRIAMFTLYEFDYRLVWQIFCVHNITSFCMDGWILASVHLLKVKSY